MSTKLNVQLLAATPEPEKIVTAAAKLCYSASDINSLLENLTADNIEKFIKILENLGHESPFEHVNFTFAVEGVSRVLTHQLVRHRIASYSQKSQRYVSEGQFKYVIPPAIESNPIAKQLYIETMERDQDTYDQLVRILIADYVKAELIALGEYREGDAYKLMKAIDELGKKYEKQAIEDARFVLPNSCETKIILTMNARSLFNFFAHRCCNRAQWEIRELAYQMLMLVREIAPNIFKHSGPQCFTGVCPEGKLSCGKIKEVREKFWR
jgi:thymidylate synthase (FAD)